MMDLSGLWAGTFTLPKAVIPTSFEVKLRDHEGMLSGAITEISQSARSRGLLLRSSLVGQASDASIEFTKMYEDVRLHVVFYAGEILDGGNAIEGLWRVAARWGGPFRMERRNAASQLTRHIEEVIVGG